MIICMIYVVLLIGHVVYDADMEDTMEERNEPPPKKRTKSTSHTVEGSGVDYRKIQQQGE